MTSLTKATNVADPTSTVSADNATDKNVVYMTVHGLGFIYMHSDLSLNADGRNVLTPCGSYVRVSGKSFIDPDIAKDAIGLARTNLFLNMHDDGGESKTWYNRCIAWGEHQIYVLSRTCHGSSRCGEKYMVFYTVHVTLDLHMNLRKFRFMTYFVDVADAKTFTTRAESPINHSYSMIREEYHAWIKFMKNTSAQISDDSLFEKGMDPFGKIGLKDHLIELLDKDDKLTSEFDKLYGIEKIPVFG